MRKSIASSHDGNTAITLAGLLLLITLSFASCSKPGQGKDSIQENNPTAASLPANPTLVTNLTELNSAIAAAGAGDVIILKDGTWSNAAINFNSVGGTSSAPITIRAQTSGNVVLTNTSSITFAAPWLVADGFKFADGYVGDNGACVIRLNSDNCKLINTSIVNYNPPAASTDNYWVYFNGNNNQVTHCYFVGKNNERPVIGNDGSDSRYNKVDHCYFKDIPFITGVNGREIFRIWGYGNGGELGTDGAFFTIEYNLLDHADGEGVEVISLKSNRNTVRYNTIIGTRGGIVLRGGHFNTVECNFILGQNVTGSTGIRVSGQGHRIVNNYIANVAGGGLAIRTGEYIAADLTGGWNPTMQNGAIVPVYLQVKDGLFANNTFVNNAGVDLEIGDYYKNGWNGRQLVLIPENNTIANNLVYKSSGSIAVRVPAVDPNPPLDIFTFVPNSIQSNLLYGGTIAGFSPSSSQIKIADPLMTLATDGLYRPGSSSAEVLNKGVTISGLTDDMDGQSRSGNPDLGSDEYFGSGTPVTRKPSTPAYVGPKLQIGMYQGCNYSGWAAGFEIGNYTMSDLIARGAVNDQASAIRVPAGLKVILYEGDNFTGTSVTLTADVSCLTSNSFNDKVSSLKVMAN